VSRSGSLRYPGLDRRGRQARLLLILAPGLLWAASAFWAAHTFTAAGAARADGIPEADTVGEQAREIPDPAARLPKGGSAVEYWDLTMELDSGHHLFVRFAITNEGPGDQVGFATGERGTTSSFASPLPTRAPEIRSASPLGS